MDEVDGKNYIIVKGAKENNLKDINVVIPKGSLTVFSGVSGSGKSTLAFDTIFQEGQRRYIESLSSYARQFLGGFEKPDVDSIEGLNPAISIDQKSASHNPRSTVGTVTEIYDYLRVLYARLGVPYCPNHNSKIEAYSPSAMAEAILHYEEGSKVQILSPIVKDEKGTHLDTITKLKKSGFARLRVDNKIFNIEDVPPLEKNKRHNIDIVIDRLIIKENIKSRVYEDVELALDYGHGYLIILGEESERLLSQHHSCPKCGFSVPELEPRLFSFNAPIGSCPDCHGLGLKREVSLPLLVPDENKTIKQGCIRYFKNIVGTSNLEWQEFAYLCNYYAIPMDKPWKDLSKQDKDIILYGSKNRLEFTLKSSSGRKYEHDKYIEGVKTRIERLYNETSSPWMSTYYESFMKDSICTSCNGQRLNEKALSVRVNGLNIAEATNLSLVNFLNWIKEVRGKATPTELAIGELLLKELESRAKFLIDVGLDYLTLSRYAMTLSGGEAQRIRLATQIGSCLSGVLYVLDEPSIGLHQKDNEKLITTLKQMRDLGNTLIVVEHDEETILSADYVVDIGVGAGFHGGEVVYQGDVQGLLECTSSITSDYLTKRKEMPIPLKRRKGNGKSIVLKGCYCHNLKHIDVEFPLGKLILITGVSGSGKSSLVNETLIPVIKKNLGKERLLEEPLCKGVSGLSNIDKLIDIDQQPIGLTPRSNPATYTGVFDDIRELYAQTDYARARGYSKARFSFNLVGGRCERCQGAGVNRISMSFLPDVYVKCEECHGKRYNEETLQCLYKGKSIHDVLEMRIEEAYNFFENRVKIRETLKCLLDVGLGYMKLGQPSTELSGGEAQRVKLATELQRKNTGKTLYVLDEPTTGLHSDDVKKLIGVLQNIVDHDNTVIIIEHNLDVIKVADHIIDLGPLGGDKGGEVVAKGTPEVVSKSKTSYTGEYLAQIFKESHIKKG